MSAMLVRLSPLPDELDRGYLGRLMRVNGFGTEKEFMGAMAAHLGMPLSNRRDLPLAQLLIMMADMTSEAFVREHTIQPIHRCISANEYKRKHGSMANSDVCFRGWKTPERCRWHFCPECAGSDLQLYGFSYWRRALQIPGQVRCSIHNVDLRYVVHDMALAQSPLVHMEMADPVDPWMANAAAKSECVNKYLALTAKLADLPQPLPAKRVSAALTVQAENLGLRCRRRYKSAPLLSDRVLQSFPRQWLAYVYPGILKKVPGEPFREMDDFLDYCTMPVPGRLLLLAAAALYPSSDAALSALAGDETRRRPSQIAVSIQPRIGSELGDDFRLAPPRVNGACQQTGKALELSGLLA